MRSVARSAHANVPKAATVIRRDRDHSLTKRNGDASSTNEACEVRLKCRCHSELTRVYTAWSLHDSTLLQVAVDLQLRKRTIDSVPDVCVLD